MAAYISEIGETYTKWSGAPFTNIVKLPTRMSKYMANIR